MYGSRGLNIRVFGVYSFGLRAYGLSIALKNAKDSGRFFCQGLSGFSGPF